MYWDLKSYWRATEMKNDVRAGVSQAKANETGFAFLAVEVFLVAVGAGLLYKSWYVFGASWIGLLIAMQFSPLATPLCIGLSLAWGAAGYVLAEHLKWGGGAEVVIAGLAFAITMGFHLGAIDHTKDLSAK